MADFPAPGQAAIGEELRDEAGIRKFLLNWFAGQGINAFKNPYAARLVGRSGEIAQLMPGYFQQDSDRRNFINQWAAQQWGGAAPSGGLDFSNAGIINQIDQTRDVNGIPTNLFRSGDSDADAQAMAAWRNIANRTYGSQIQNTAARLEAEKGLQFGQWRQNNPTWSGDYADWRLGKTPVTQGFTPPAGTNAGTGFTPPGGTPAATSTTQAATTTPTGATAFTTPATTATDLAKGNAAWANALAANGGVTRDVSGNVSGPGSPGYNPWTAIAQNGAAAPQGTLPAGATGTANTGTPGAPITGPGYLPNTTVPVDPRYQPWPERQGNPPGTPGAGQYTYPENPNRPGATPASNAAITNWKQLLDKYRGDQRNWSTRMMGNPSEGFSIGGITYNPQAEAAQGSQRYRNMSGQGRETARGSNFGVFMYRLNQLMSQRDRGGNAALGITRATTDDQLARMAQQFVAKNYVGTSAIT